LGDPLPHRTGGDTRDVHLLVSSSMKNST
jgi:hypothetical protein